MKASTTSRSTAAPTVNGAPTLGPPAVRTPLPTRQRRTGYAALGVLLIAGLGAAFGYLYTTAGEKVPVVVVTSSVSVGEVIERSDLSTVDVAGDITAIAGANLESVVGERAAVALLPNTVLQRSMVTDVDPTPAGMVQVGVAVKGGQIPADGLTPGDTVQVLRLPAAGGTGGAGRAGGRCRQGDGVRRAAGSGAGRGDPADVAGPGGAGRGGGRCERRRRRRVGEGAGEMIVSVCSDKGSPGVTTLAAALWLVWPGERVLLDADTAGGDLPFRLWSNGSGAPRERLSSSPSIASLATAARLGLTAAGPLPFAQDTSLGVPVVPGALSAERFRPLRAMWPRVAAELAAWPGTVIADLGRLQPGNDALPVAQQSTAVLLVTRVDLESLAHLRDRVAELAGSVGDPGRDRSPVGVVVTGPPKARRFSRGAGPSGAGLDRVAGSGGGVPGPRPGRCAGPVGGGDDQAVRR